MEAAKTFESLSKIFLSLCFFLPIFFLPFTQNVLDFPKESLFSFLIFFSLIFYLLSQISKEEFSLRENKILFLFLFLFFISFFLSTVFSILPKSSFFGWPFNIVDNFISFSLFLIFCFLIANVFKDEIDFLFSTLLFLISATIVAIFSLLQIYGIFILPFDFSKIPSFNLIGNVYSGAIFSALIFPLSFSLIFKGRGFLRIVFVLISSILLIQVLLTNYKDAWLCLLFGILTLVIFGFYKPKGKIRFFFLGSAFLFLILSIFFIFFPARLPHFPPLPLQIFPSFDSEIGVLREVFKEGLKRKILGQGPATFYFAWSKYHSPLLNQTLFWGTRFSIGNSEFLDFFVTKGILGGLILILFFFILVYFILKELIKSPDWLKLGLFSSTISAMFSFFLIPFNFIFWFGFFFFVGSLIFFISKERKLKLISHLSRILFSFLFTLLFLLGLTLLYHRATEYLAEVNYKNGIFEFQKGKIDSAISKIQKAANLNPSIDLYWRDLAQIYLAKANSIAQDQNLTLTEKGRLTRQVISDGIDSLNQAIRISPLNSANWNVRGYFYRNLIGIEGADELALDSYKRASQLESASPYSFGEIGRVYILIAQELQRKGSEEERNEALSLAIKSLEEALRLKPDYAPAHYLLAVALDQRGEIDQAISKLEETKMISPFDIGVAFQLGNLYWRKGDLERAENQFKEILELNPDHSNSHYMLGLIFDKKGEREKAIEEFEIVLKLNPENREVKKILENLKKGLPALEGIVTPQVEEIPPEFKK